MCDNALRDWILLGLKIFQQIAMMLQFADVEVILETIDVVTSQLILIVEASGWCHGDVGMKLTCGR